MTEESERVLLDTNVLLSAVLFGGRPGELVELVRSGRVRGVTSLYILREFQEVLTRPRFGVAPELAEELAAELGGMMEVVAVESTCNKWVTDSKDDPVVEAALQAGATVIVAGDRRLLWTEIPGVRVLSVAEMMGWLPSEWVRGPRRP